MVQEDPLGAYAVEYIKYSVTPIVGSYEADVQITYPHNMRDAIEHGNRLIMMNEGRIVLDIAGEEKKRLTVDSLLAKFSRAAGEDMVTDRVLIGA